MSLTPSCNYIALVSKSTSASENPAKTSSVLQPPMLSLPFDIDGHAKHGQYKTTHTPT